MTKNEKIKQKVCLVVIDGWGLSDDEHGNAILKAKTPIMDKLCSANWQQLEAHGLHVGLPEGLMGNSEVGHLNIGAGRVVYQVSDGGVHSHIDHLFALIRAFKELKVPKLFIHFFADGRDTSPTSGVGYLEQLLQFISSEGYGELATIVGRYYAMDRDKRWERIKVAYEAIIGGMGQKSTLDRAVDVVRERYSQSETDEFLKPIVFSDDSHDDTLIFFNYRADRMRQICECLGMERYKDLGSSIPHPKNIQVTGMTQYNKEFQDEERCMVPSPKVATYDLQPEMNAAGVADKMVEQIKLCKHPFVMCNFAPPDMVGHTGQFEPAVKACEATDAAIGRIYEACKEYNYVLMVTADHDDLLVAVNQPIVTLQHPMNFKELWKERGGSDTTRICRFIQHNPLDEAHDNHLVKQVASEAITGIKHGVNSLKRRKLEDDGDSQPANNSDLTFLVEDEEEEDDSTIRELRLQLANVKTLAEQNEQSNSEYLAQYREFVKILCGYDIRFGEDGFCEAENVLSKDCVFLFQKQQIPLDGECSTSNLTTTQATVSGVDLLDSESARQWKDVLENYLLRYQSIPAFLSAVTIALVESPETPVSSSRQSSIEEITSSHNSTIDEND
ncbi:hypothetical protein Mgra_00002371 [Meloidogyne graminicola]|uniref:phosphoglycerate mutase (2,3-diphosphoglycerate-independent) n=1 Tax=Meloidogyne graminicola TaxID=189291 RepID=A0A8S9ZYA3_9BILA|nr:hypothetical protein Mgra_00002371 [Meloidogyne graminicola]